MELSDIPIYVYPILFILLVIIVAVVSLLIGKRKYNKDNGIVKEKKVKEPKQKKAKEGKKLKRAEESAPAKFTDEFDSDEDYDNAVESLKSESGKPKQKVDGPVIVVDENKVNEEEVIEWKPPSDDKAVVDAAPESDASVTDTAAQNSAVAATAAAAPLAAPSEENWDDDDLELFEARAYSFDEETQSGYVSGKPSDADAEPVIEAPVETPYAFRERKESSRDPADDEGVQVFENTDEKPEPAAPKAKDEKANNTKYAYFDAVMEKEKSEVKETEWQPPQARSKPESSLAETSNKPKKSMQYIELDLDDKE
ncbi:hypothetical protein [Methanimicrococcus stummii]|nr:hypothetical protein [Methanimicrococcus sp. Es2]